MTPNAQSLSERASRIGVVINLMLPTGIALLAYALRAANVVPTLELATASPPILFLLFGALALGELVAAFLLKRQLFTQKRVAPIRHDSAAVEQWLVRSSLIIFGLGAAPMLYGSILYVLSGDLRQLAFFGIVTLIGYRLFRPTTSQLDDILEEPKVVS